MDKQQNIVAIDPSLTGTAVASGCVVDEIQVWRFSSKKVGDSLEDRFARYALLAARIAAKVATCSPQAVILEGYSYGSMHAHQPIYEFGAVLRMQLLDLAIPIAEIPPTSLKKFVTGKGNAGKEQMAAFAAKRFGAAFHTNDETDAYCLCMMGLVALGLAEGTKADRAAAEIVTRVNPELAAMVGL